MYNTYRDACSTYYLHYLLFLGFTEAQQYIDLLQTDGVNIPVDSDDGSYTMQLPDWYDEKLFKR